jgi:hypothetical protein
LPLSNRKKSTRNQIKSQNLKIITKWISSKPPPDRSNIRLNTVMRSKKSPLDPDPIPITTNNNNNSSSNTTCASKKESNATVMMTAMNINLMTV